VEYGRRFLVKLWNVSGFASKLLADYGPAEAGAPELQVLDRWILSKAEKLTQAVTEALEKCQFNIAVEAIRNFTWHVFCDSYVEAVKDRLYKPEAHGDAKRLAAQQTLYEVLYRILQLLAPIIPHLTEEIYQIMYAEHKRHASLQVSPWPEFNTAPVDEHAEKQGDLVVALIGEVRREKAEKRLPLNTQIRQLTVYAGDHSAAEAIAEGEGDIVGACKVASLKVLPEEGAGRDVAQYPTVHFAAEFEEGMKK
jgi:valyl-tRNA synthetase